MLPSALQALIGLGCLSSSPDTTYALKLPIKIKQHVIADIFAFISSVAQITATGFQVLGGKFILSKLSVYCFQLSEYFVCYQFALLCCFDWF